MKATLVIFHCLLVFTASALGQSPALGSNAAAASPEDSRLRQMESIYLQQLRALHIPLLSKYVTDLQKLAAKAADPAPYQREITRIQGIIAKGGIVDLAAAVQSLKAPSEPPPEPGAPPVPRLRRGVLQLSPGLAASIQPIPDTSASPDAAAVGSIQWRIESLAAGNYDVIAHYACPVLKTSLPLVLKLGEQELTLSLDTSKTTRSAESYRILRIGQLDLANEISGGTLTLQAGTPESSAFLLKQLILTPIKLNE